MNNTYTKEELEKLSVKDLVDVYMDVNDSKNNSKKLFDMCIGNMLDDLSENEHKLVDYEIELLMIEAYEKSAEAMIELFNKDELITMIIYYGNNQNITKKLPALTLRTQDLLSRSVESFVKRIENILE